MANNELLDDWPPRQPKNTAGNTVRPDPIDMLFSGIPEPVIVHAEEEELAIQRAPSTKLILNLVLWFFGSIAMIWLLVYLVGIV